MKVRYTIQRGGKLTTIESDTEKVGCWFTFDEANPETVAYSLSPEEAFEIWTALGMIFGFPQRTKGKE